jgi:pimeloyl-ACP methyl ester carboxylesterase
MHSTTDVRYIDFENGGLSYNKFGSGHEVLLAFHGFDQNKSIYNSLQDSIDDRFTIYAFDLFLHGETYYLSDQPLTKNNWNTLLMQFLNLEAIDRFSLIGYSLGGRFALITIEAFAKRIDKLILIAPDGITNDFFYRLATRSSLGRKFFGYLIIHPHIVILAGHLLKKIGLLDKRKFGFAKVFLRTVKRRRLLYRRWITLRLISPDLRRISELINANTIDVRFLIGDVDCVVPYSHMQPLTKLLKSYGLSLVKANHTQLIRIVNKQLLCFL